jgi:hypothetical protein
MDARASRPNALQQLTKNCCLQIERPMSCPDAAYANSSLSRIIIYVAYLKRLIGCVFVRIQYEFLYAKRGCLFLKKKGV